MYVIKNADYNANINPGETITLNLSLDACDLDNIELSQIPVYDFDESDTTTPEKCVDTVLSYDSN